MEEEVKERITERVKASERLIVALDLPTVEEAKELVLSLSGVVSFFKIGLELQFDAGRPFIEWLRKRECRVFLDLKFFDIEETVRRAVAQVASIGADFLTVHGGDQAILKAAVDGRWKSALKILAVTVLTSMDSENIKDLVCNRAKMAKEIGCDGIVTSGMEVRLIREQVTAPLLVVVPGIRPKESETHDQKRTVTPTHAISAGADYLVVGRPIRDAQDKKAAAKAILAEMQTALDTRYFVSRSSA